MILLLDVIWCVNYRFSKIICSTWLISVMHLGCELVTWADNRVSASEAFAKATAELISHLKKAHTVTPTSLPFHLAPPAVDCHSQFSTLRLWNNMTSVSTSDGLNAKMLAEPMTSTCKHCEGGYQTAIASFRVALWKLPQASCVAALLL